MARRVVVTACSAITPIGHTKKDIVRHLVEGISGVIKLRTDDLLSDFIQTGVFGTVDYPIAYDFKRQDRKTMGPVSYYACQVAKEVLEASGLNQEFITSGRLGVAFGSTHGSPTVQRQIYKTFFGNSKSRLCFHRGRGLSEIDGPHHGGEYHQDVRHYRKGAVFVHGLYHQQPVHWFRI